MILARFYLKSGSNFAVRLSYLKWNQRKNGQFIGLQWQGPADETPRIAALDPRQIEAILIEDSGPTIN